MIRGGLGGGGSFAFLQGWIRPPADPKDPPFGTFYEIQFWLTGLNLVPPAHLAPIYTNFEGKREPKNAFCGQNFPRGA